MRFSKFKKTRYIQLAIDLDELNVYHPSNNKSIKLVEDERSFVGDFENYGQFWHVYPIAESNTQYYIACPYCGEIHIHGKVPGHRVSHCEAKSNNDNGYVITLPQA